MAIIYQATLSPSKLELLTKYVEGVPALAEQTGEDLRLVGSYRFDDPAGEVGIETHILTSDSGVLLQIPVVYRNEALAGADASRMGTMQHSILGERFMYDACIDAVYIGELVRTILSGDVDAVQMVETPDGPVPRDSTVKVRGSGTFYEVAPPPDEVEAVRSGTETEVVIDGYAVTIPHVLAMTPSSADLSLHGKWDGQDSPITLAVMVSSVDG